MNNADDGTIRIVCIASTFQDAGIATLQAKGEYVETNVRASLIDNAYDSKRYADLCQLHSVRTSCFFQDSS